MFRLSNLNRQYNAVVQLASRDSTLGSKEGEGHAFKPLAGVPILVKDSLDVQGLKTVCGSPRYINNPPAKQDAKIVAMLRSLGAHVIGKTNLPAFSEDVQTFNSVFGVTENPYCAGFTAGGSSGGSAAAVALGMAPLAVGTDWAGSLRIPAAFCGVCSMRASVGSVFTIDGSDAILPPMPRDPADTGHSYVSGIITKTIGDLRYAMTALIENPQLSRNAHDKEAVFHVQFERSFQTKLSEDHRNSRDAVVRIGVTPVLPGVPTERRVVEAFRNLPQMLLNLSASDNVAFECRLVEPPPWDWREIDRANKTFSSGWNLKSDKDLDLRRQQNAAAHVAQEKYREALEAFLQTEEISAWILPVCGMLPFRHNFDHSDFVIDGKMVSYWRPLRGYVVPFTLTGHPVVSMPLKLVDKLPLGMQVVASMNEDESLLWICEQLEHVLGRLESPGASSNTKEFPISKL